MRVDGRGEGVRVDGRGEGVREDGRGEGVREDGRGEGGKRGWEGRGGKRGWEGRGGKRGWVGEKGLFLFFSAYSLYHSLVPMCTACVVIGQGLLSTCLVTPYSSSIAESFSVILACSLGLRGTLLVC